MNFCFSLETYCVLKDEGTRLLFMPTAAIRVRDTEIVNFRFGKRPVYSAPKRFVLMCQRSSVRDTEFVNFCFCLEKFSVFNDKICLDTNCCHTRH